MVDIIKELANFPEIKQASFFAFSTENWKRSKEEIDFIFNAAESLLNENQKDFEFLNVRICHIGDLSKFPNKLQDAITQAVEKTKNNTGLVVNLVMDYGGRRDIVLAAEKLAKSGEKFSEENLMKNLLCPFDIDLLVRTSGEIRISNFMLFQLAYSELYFTKKYWPDFSKRELHKALNEYGKRNRRFGGN